ncbi:hypothetical protein DFH09DRAFT_554442 [Mycena vulgaris]|nr:hypothetical protein DFH09DRAFT_554442 [Mycena vulgaris]
MTSPDWANLSSAERPCSNCGFLSGSIQAAYPDLPALPHQLLTTNDPPSDNQAAEIRDIIDNGDNCISSLDSSVVMLEGILEKLRRTRADAIDHRHRSSSLLSTRCLPDDVLGEIFSHTVPDTQPGQSVLDRSPWVLGRVCSRWRAASVSLSALWSIVDCSLPPAIVRAHLERSKARGLTIQLTRFDSDTEAIASVVKCSSRWETVDLEGPHVHASPLLARVHGKLPMLRELKYQQSVGVISSRGPGAFQIAPKLSSVTFDGWVSLKLPWSQITRLRQSIPDIDGLNHLASIRNLVELSLTGQTPISISSALSLGLPEASIAEFPCLRVLYIDDGKFLNFLVLPMLEDIWISQRATPLVSFIDRSSCRLRKFSIMEDLSFQDLLSILDRTPTLLEMRLLISEDVDSLIAHLTIPHDADDHFRPTFPKLHTISMWIVNPRPDYDLLGEMIESRTKRTICANLSLSILHYATHLSDHELAGLERLRAQGADIGLDRLRARGTDVECLPAPESSGRILRSWKTSYP